MTTFDNLLLNNLFNDTIDTSMTESVISLNADDKLADKDINKVSHDDTTEGNMEVSQKDQVVNQTSSPHDIELKEGSEQRVTRSTSHPTPISQTEPNQNVDKDTKQHTKPTKASKKPSSKAKSKLLPNDNSDRNVSKTSSSPPTDETTIKSRVYCHDTCKFGGKWKNKHMMRCIWCMEWTHSDCVEDTTSEIDAVGSWCCMTCRKIPSVIY
jgi:hypothetical protein